jgi:rubrerythrin
MKESIDATRLGRNRTGLLASPECSERMNDMVQPVTAEAAGPHVLEDARLDYIREADPLGSVPPPPTLKGKVKSAAKMMKGDRPQAFIDKLAERLAFERGGTRLYDGILAKFIAHRQELPDVELSELEEIRNQEASHAALIRTCIEQLGADPTAQTPCADLVGVETSGFIQAVSDPRTTLAQSLHAALAAELIDGAGWDNLIALAEGMGQTDMAKRFRIAREQEAEHLIKVQRWYDSLTLQTAHTM